MGWFLNKKIKIFLTDLGKVTKTTRIQNYFVGCEFFNIKRC